MAVFQADVFPDYNKMNKKSESRRLSRRRELLVQQEIKLAKALADNNQKVRDRALKSLKRWLQSRPNMIPFTQEDFMRIWKGLFYTHWMSDKLLYQEQCAENISQLVFLEDIKSSILFFKCGILTIKQEWYGLDNFRINKFQMLTRRLLRKGFEILKRNKWKRNGVLEFCAALSDTVLHKDFGFHLGFVMHFIEIYWEELAKVSGGKIHPSLITLLVRPFVVQLSEADDGRLVSHVVKYIFQYLLKQSDKGLEYDEKYEAWKRTGFKGDSIDCIVKETVENDELDEDGNEEEEEERILDPRAGRVDVILPQINFSPKEILNLLTEFRMNVNCTTRGRKAFNKLVSDFSKQTRGEYPLGIKKFDIPKEQYSTKLKQSVNRLVKFEKKLMEGDQKKRKRRRKDLQIERQEEEEFEEVPRKKRKKTMSKDWSSDFFGKKLEEFLQENRTKKLKRSKKKSVPQVLDGCEYSFERNSGVWLVYPNHQENANEIAPSSSNPTEEMTNSIVENGLEQPEKSFKRKRRKRSNSSAADVLVKNPFSPSPGAKKVKIDLKLNKSQEIHEHHAQILSSPGIPFDTNKKPSKPLLKPTAVSTPLNPFYRKKLSL